MKKQLKKGGKPTKLNRVANQSTSMQNRQRKIFEIPA